MKLTIRKKLFILVAIIVTAYGLAVGFILISFKSRLTEDARQLTITYLKENAGNAASIINGDFEIARTAAAGLAATTTFDTEIRETLTGKWLESIVKQNKRYLSTWLSMELAAIDPDYTKTYGRKRYTYYQSGVPVFDTVNMDGDVPNSLYYNLKQAKKEALTEPYLLSSTSSIKDNRNEYLGTSVCVPLLLSGEFIGLAGMDITLEGLDFIARIKPYPGSSSFLLSAEGTIVAHENKEVVGKKLSRILRTDSLSLFDNLAHGQAMSWISSEEDVLVAFTPLRIGQSDNYWSIGTIVPMQAITSSITPILIKTLLISIGGLIILVISVYMISARITSPINLVNDKLKELAKGHIKGSLVMKRVSDDETGEMIASVNGLITNLNEKMNFAVEIGAGKFDTEFVSSDPDDTLGQALQTMRRNLKEFRDDDEKRKWANEGLTRLNDVLRINLSNQEEFYFQALKTIIYYLKANQGGLFLVENEDDNGSRYIDLVAAYAYERKKFLKKRIEWGESLVGQCILEKEIVFMKKLPEDYIKITSGLGAATPGVLVIVPLKTDTAVVGAIEIASFKEYEPHEMQFLNKAAEIMASSIISFRNNLRTQTLMQKSEFEEYRVR